MKHFNIDDFDSALKGAYSEDVYDLDEEYRVSLDSHPRYGATFDTVGVDQLTPVDSVVRMNGDTVFITEV